MKGTQPVAFRLAALALVLAGASCRSAPEPAVHRQASPPPSLAKVLEVKRPFVPPADGRLEPAQVEMYLAVQRRAWTLVEGDRAGTKPAAEAKTNPTAALALAGAELRAAELLGYDPAEYRWVRDRVAEASVLPSAAALDGLAALVQTAALESRRELVRELGSPEGRESGAPAHGDPAAREWNRKLLEAVSGREPRS
ncbi:MAG TPA: hypothetical protein VIZ31_05550 [Vicinamibacteria bacterium]